MATAAAVFAVALAVIAAERVERAKVRS